MSSLTNSSTQKYARAIRARALRTVSRHDMKKQKLGTATSEATDAPSARPRPRVTLDSFMTSLAAREIHRRHESNTKAPTLRDAKGLPPCDAYPLTPCLIIDEDAVKFNVNSMFDFTRALNDAEAGHNDAADDGDRWRPHLKTTKSSRIWSMLIERGVRRFKVATSLELEVLIRTIRAFTDARSRSRDCEEIVTYDVLLAYPLASPAAWTMLAKIFKDNDCSSESGPIRVSVLVDSPDAFREVPEHMFVFADLNLGMNRTGSTDIENFIYSCAEYFGERLVGVSMYEGQYASESSDGIHDTDHGLMRQTSCDSTHEKFMSALESAVSRCKSHQSTSKANQAFATSASREFEVLTSGTPSFVPALKSKHLRKLASMGLTHRVSPGTVVLHDARGARQNPGMFQHACFVLATIVSKPTEHLVTCNAGSKSLACESGNPAAFVVNHPNWVPMSPSEEHLPIFIGDYDEWQRVKRGDHILLVPEHACPTVSMYAKYVVKNTITDGERCIQGDIDARGRHFGFVKRS